MIKSIIIAFALFSNLGAIAIPTHTLQNASQAKFSPEARYGIAGAALGIGFGIVIGIMLCLTQPRSRPVVADPEVPGTVPRGVMEWSREVQDLLEPLFPDEEHCSTALLEAVALAQENDVQEYENFIAQHPLQYLTHPAARAFSAHDDMLRRAAARQRLKLVNRRWDFARRRNGLWERAIT